MKTSQSQKRVVDLCIYVDQNAYSPNVDKERIFDALYNIVLRICHKHKLLQKFEDYEQFALYGASRLYTRLINPRQFLPEDNPRKLKKVKSILNLTKATLSPMLIDWQQSEYAQRFGLGDTNKNLQDCAEDIRLSLEHKARRSMSQFLKIDYEYYLNKITDTMRAFIKTTPYKEDPVMSHRLYVSCLMTFLNQITLCNSNKERLRVKESGGYKLDDFINKVYQMEKEKSVVTFKLDASMHNYVDVIVNRMRSLVVKDLVALIGDAEPSESVMQSIIASNFGGGGDYDKE